MEKEIKSFEDLEGIYSQRYIQVLKEMAEAYQLSFEEIYAKLPSPALVQKDEKFTWDLPVARVLMGVSDPATHVLTCFHLIDAIPKDYLEQPKYYISTSEGSVDAPFTKTEFLESVKQEEGKKLIRKKG